MSGASSPHICLLRVSPALLPWQVVPRDSDLWLFLSIRPSEDSSLLNKRSLKMTTGRSPLRHGKWQNRPLRGWPIMPHPNLSWVTGLKELWSHPVGGTVGLHSSARGGWSSVLLAFFMFALLFLPTFCSYCHCLCDFWSGFSLSLFRVHLSWFFTHCFIQSETIHSFIPEVFSIFFFFQKIPFELSSAGGDAMDKSELLKNPHNYFCLPNL